MVQAPNRVAAAVGQYGSVFVERAKGGLGAEYVEMRSDGHLLDATRVAERRTLATVSFVGLEAAFGGTIDGQDGEEVLVQLHPHVVVGAFHDPGKGVALAGLHPIHGVA